MDTPEQDESQRFNEPHLLEAEGFLNRAWRRLGEGLGPYVAGKTGDDSLSGTRDVHAILSRMVARGSWEAHFGELGHSVRGSVNQLRDFRNGPWAHLVGYSDKDVLHYLGVIERLLKVVSADEQAEAVERMHVELGKLIFSQSTPERQRDSENAELRQRVSELEKERLDLLNRNSQISGQLEGFRTAASLMAPSPASASHVIPPDVAAGDDGLTSVSPPFLTETAEEFLRQGNKNRSEGYIEDAIGNYTRAIELNSRLAEAYVGRGDAWMDGEEYESAIADYDDALRLNPDDAVAYFYRAFAYAVQGELDRAISDYSDTLRLTVIDELALAAHANRGNAYRDQGEYDLAISDCDEALGLNPDDEVAAALYFNRGNSYFDQGEQDQAIADFDAALELDPELARAYYKRGDTYFQKGSFDEAIMDYGDVLRLDPEDSTAYVSRGLAHFYKEEYELAINDMGLAVNLTPDFPFPYVMRGLAYAFKDEHDRAIADFETGIALEPDNELAELARNSMMLSLGSKDRAIRLQERAEYNRYIQENPRDPQGWHLLGLHSLECEDYSSAVAEFTIAIKWVEWGMGPDNAEVWRDRGWAYWQQGEDDLAYEDYSKAIELEPDFANAYYNRAWVWRRRGEHGNAIIDFSHAIALKPDYAAAYEHRGESYFFVDDPELGQADRNRARDLGFNP